jgi:hypothetical protein
MSFQVAGWPLPDDVDRYQRELGMPREAIVRDIARLITVAQMVHDGKLNDDFVLTGGMAMRLRGSPRFTMSDTDTSRRLREPPDRVEGEFTFTVSWRGLIEPTQPLLLIHPYAELELPRTIVPVMDLTEQIAEKILGWSAHGLMKHYVDVAWAFYRLADQIDPSKLGRLVDAKLEVGRALFPTEYAAFPTRAALRARSSTPTPTSRPKATPATTRRGSCASTPSR